MNKYLLKQLLAIPLVFLFFGHFAFSQNVFFYKNDKSLRSVECELDSLKSKHTLKELYPYPEEITNSTFKSYSMEIQQMGHDWGLNGTNDSLPKELLSAIKLENRYIFLRFEYIWIVNNKTNDSIQLKPFNIYARQRR